MAAKIPEAHLGTFPGSFKYNPMVALRETFIGFLQGLFAAAPPGVGCWHWDEDDGVSEIVIRDEATVREEVLGKRPLITLLRGPIQFATLGFDDMVSYESDTGKKTKGVLVAGTMTMNCCSRESIESESLAWVAMEYTWLLRELLISNSLLFDTGMRPQMGSPSPAGSIISDDKGQEWICTSVSFPYQFVRTSAFTPLGLQIVQSIENRVSSNLYKVRNTGPPSIAHAHEGSVPSLVQVCPPPPFTSASDAYGRTPDPGGQRQYFLPKQPHPLNPAVEVTVRTARPYRPGFRGVVVGVPIPDPCVKESV
jgi:hypothetical protein